MAYFGRKLTFCLSFRLSRLFFFKHVLGARLCKTCLVAIFTLLVEQLG